MVREAKKLEKIFTGELTPTFFTIKYNTAQKRKGLKNLKILKKEILKRREVNWQELNTFVIKL